MSERRHLIKRKETWYVRKRVPKDAQHVLGRELTQTTQTQNLNEARSLRWSILASMQQRIDAARASRDPGSPAWVVNYAKEALRSIRQGETDQAVVDETGLDLLIDQLTKLRGFKLDEHGNPIIPDEATDAALDSASALLGAGPDASLLSDAIETYLDEKERGNIAAKTISAKRRRLEAFKDWHGDRPIETVTRRAAGRYTELLLSRERAPKTTRDELSDLGAFFKWARQRGRVEYNPFDGMGSTVTESSRGGTKFSRRAWTEDELKAMLTGLDQSNAIQARLYALIALGAYTGARLNELCETKLEDVHDDRIHIPEGKTESSVRDVPLHKAIRPLVKRLKKASTDGYLVSGLRQGGEDKRRSHYISKDAGRLQRKLKVADLETINRRSRNRIDFHALRRTFNSAMRRAGVPTDVREAIVGHSSGNGVNESLYLDPVEFKVLAKAVNKVSYGEVDKLVRAARSS